ncbi:MAG: hypothetical protein ACREOS_04875 [Candidatus Dormibacteraceae bacterium]
MNRLDREAFGPGGEDSPRRERIRAARELAALALDDVPEPEILARQLAEACELPD